MDSQGSQQLQLHETASWVGPTTHVQIPLVRLRDAAGLAAAADEARRGAAVFHDIDLRPPLVVTADGDHYRVADDEREYHRLLAHVAAQTDAVWCAVANPDYTGRVLEEVHYVIARVTVALCRIDDTTVLGRP